jgi:Ca2+-binding RTX toxin-like protein
VLAGNVENLILQGSAISGTGNAMDNTITGNAAANHLHGAAGNDTMTGGFGDDILDGGIGNDRLDGGDGTDHLLGGAGNDRLEGGVGADILEGGAGNDLYRVDDLQNKVVEGNGQGTDTVETELDGYTLTGNVENLTLLGSGATAGHGNALSNHLTGNVAGNLLTGEAGNDRIDGQGGDDNLVGGAGNDMLLGQDGNDALSGGAGNDVIEGGHGQDILSGGAGKDLFVYKTADDGPVDLPNLGGDTIVDFQRGQDKLDVGDLFSDFGLSHGGSALDGGHILFTQSGADTIVQFDPDGTGGGAPFTLATVVGIKLTDADIVH